MKRLKTFCFELVNLDIEPIFVDDGSHDQTRGALKSFASEDSRIMLIGFARNFAHQLIDL
jgi:dolichol-phosphate mannosyltransferase